MGQSGPASKTTPLTLCVGYVVTDAGAGSPVLALARAPASVRSFNCPQCAPPGLQGHFLAVSPLPCCALITSSALAMALVNTQTAVKRHPDDLDKDIMEHNSLGAIQRSR